MSGAYSPMEKKLMELLDPLPADALEANWSDAELTRQLAAKLGAAGREAGFWVGSPHWAKADDPHWPLDLAWLEKAGGQLKRVPMVLGMEWGLQENQIIPQFHKLLVSRAEVRVMALQQKTKQEAQARLEALVRQIEAFGQSTPGDRYLLACNDFKSAAFTFRLHVCP
ncbi:MAG: hypothetical protein HY910_01205 [Desulfarculus sp.]|nr:hypothetical protein [Desulfarculus sp.]